MTRKMIFKKLKKIIVYCFKVDEKKVTYTASFEQNRDFIIFCPYFPIKELTKRLRLEFNIDIPPEYFMKERRIKTVGDLINYIYENQERGDFDEPR